MWKMFDWLWKAAAAALLASFLAIWTTGYIVNSYVEALLEEYEIPLEKPPFALSGLWGRLWGVDAAGEPRDGLAADREPIGGMEDARSHAGGEGGSSGPGAGQPDGSGDRSGSGSETAVPDPAGGASGGGGMTDGAGGPDEAAGLLPDEAGEGAPSGATEETGFGTGPEARGGAGASGETVVSTEDLLEAKSRLTDDERNRLFAILVGKVPQEEWQRISEFTEGGLTADELLQVQQIVATYLDRGEYDELMGILSKF
jgi:hypothetical protein